jgi:hypothetical protein
LVKTCELCWTSCELRPNTDGQCKMDMRASVAMLQAACCGVRGWSLSFDHVEISVDMAW